MHMKKFFTLVVLALLAVGCALLGLLASILADTPVGASIVAVNILAFAVCCLVGRATGANG